MQYKTVKQGIFRARPNRFIAHVELAGETCVCHVKNTGRCRELLLDGATVYVEGNLLINMDSQAPNRAAAEFLPKLLPGLTLLRPETVYGSSRFDFYAEAGRGKWFWEVKGVTLEEDGTAMFPDAPTQRGVKHLKELCACLREGYRAGILFVIQMKGVSRFIPNDRTHPEFGEALRAAAAAGVRVLAYDCLVTPDTLSLDAPVPVFLNSPYDTPLL